MPCPANEQQREEPADDPAPIPERLVKNMEIVGSKLLEDSLP
jgi:hypothetical protein